MGMPHASLSGMTDATFACYDVAAARSISVEAAPQSTGQPEFQSTLPHPSLQPFNASRVRDALGYRPWTPPAQDWMSAAPASGVGGRIAHAAVTIRHKLPGRILYRLAPASLVERLKQYLR